MTTRFALLALLAACHSNAATPSNTATAPGPAPATPSTPFDCGTVDASVDVRPANAPAAYRCFVDAFDHGRVATVSFHGVSDEGGHGYATYRSVPGIDSMLVEITYDDRDDGFAAAPGIHKQICTAIRIEGTTSGGVTLYPEGCTDAP